MKPQDNICPFCGADNPIGTISCTDCGGALAAQSAPPSIAPPAPALAPLPPVMILVERCGTTVLQLTFTKGEILFGRADVADDGTPVIPDVDLTDADRERLVSRRHLLLRIERNGITATDQGSGNGTFIESVGKLTPHQATPVPSGARIMLGRGGIVLTATI